MSNSRVIPATRNPVLIGVLCALQLSLLVLPIPVLGASGVSLIALGVVSLFVVTSSVYRAMLFLIFVSVVIPGYISQEHLLLPGDFKFAEGLFMAVLFFALITALKDGVVLPRTPLNRPMTVFLGLVVLSVAVGLYQGHSISQLLRDVRYPFYYGLFYIFTAFFPSERPARYLNLLVLIGAIVGLEYLVEFMSAINLSISGQFHRVARTEGLMLPIGTLIVAAMWLYLPSRNVRLVSGLALIPIALAFVLTVGRGMWISAAVGFLALTFIYLRDPQRVGLRNSWAIVGVPMIALLIGSTFESITDTSVSSVATRRLSAIETFDDDRALSTRLISYRVALTKILRRPVLGGGHGETVTYPSVISEMPGIVTLGGVDNVYLTILLRMGVVGLAAFLWIYLRSLRIAYRLFRSSRDPEVRVFTAAFFAVYAAMLVYGVADQTMMSTRLILVHAASLGVLATLSEESSS
jgi:O-antigen ligase